MTIKAPKHLAWRVALEKVDNPVRRIMKTKDPEEVYVRIQKNSLNLYLVQGFKSGFVFSSEPYTWMYSKHASDEICLKICVSGIKMQKNDNNTWKSLCDISPLSIKGYFKHISGNIYNEVIVR